MALHTKAEFGRLCSKDSAYITMYIKRGNLIAQTDKDGKLWIDDTLEVNRNYMKKWQRQAILNPKPKPKPKAQTSTTVKPGTKKTSSKKVPKPKTNAALSMDRLEEKDFINNPDIGDLGDDVKFSINLNQREQVLRIRKLEEETEIKRLQKEKLLGLNIPIAEVKLIFGQTFTSFAAHFREASDDIAEIMCARLGGGTVELNDIRMQLESVINESVDKAKEASREALKTQSDNYSDTRGRGERKV